MVLAGIWDKGMLGIFLLKQKKMSRKKYSNKRADVSSNKILLFKRYLIIPCVIFLLIFILFRVLQGDFFPITTVQVVDPYGRVDQTALQAAVDHDIQHGFFQINLSTVKNDVLTLPWVKDVEVARKWPNKIQITINERVPLAHWNQHSLVDTDGYIFTPKTSSLPNTLPNFQGSADNAQEMLINYTKFNQILASKNLQVETIKVTDRHSWLITLDNGIQIELGREEILQRLDRFVQIYDTIFASTHKKAQYVDMRYPNAMAVRWQNS